MTRSAPAPGVRGHSRVRRRWRPGWVTWIVAVLSLTGLGLLLYSPTASWFTQVHQSRLIEAYDRLAIPPKEERPSPQIKVAQEYNDLLASGAVLAANTNVPTSDSRVDGFTTDYNDILSFSDSGIMARLRVPSIDVDLPIYHGTSDETLLRGAGHLEGTSLPVGGPDTHSVITAHRGLANATMFTNLDKVKVGDQFVIEVAGEVLVYQVITTEVVDPADTERLNPSPGKDLVTLVTCTPLGINTQRILVTGERVQASESDAALEPGKRPEVPGFPTWAAILAGGLALIGIYLWRSGLQPVDVPRRGEPAAATD